MTFWDHAEALRGAIIRAVVLVGILTCVCFVGIPWFFDHVVLAPCNRNFPVYTLLEKIAGGAIEPTAQISLVNLQLASQFTIHMSASLWGGILLSLPGCACLAWKFVRPALTENERPSVRRAVTYATMFFYLGVLTAYFTLFPLTLQFLAGYRLAETVPNQISLESYYGTFVTLCTLMGVAFELPIGAWLLGRCGILHRGHFSRFRRHAIIAVLALSAIITPTGDPFTLLVVFLPLYLLWELSALCVPKRDMSKTTAIDIV